MKEFIKIKVQDVLQLLSVLERDINELSSTNESISENRDYSYSLKKSIEDEISKLQSIKDSILELDVDMPKAIYTRSYSEEENFKQIANNQLIEKKDLEKINKQEIPQVKKERKVHRY